jgi:hypothetical protein
MKVNTQNYQTESDVKGTDRVAVPGFFHCNMVGANDSRVKKDGSPLNATIFEGEVLAGTVPGQEGKKVVLYYSLGENGEENDEYTGKVSRLAMACKLIGGGQPDRNLQAEDFDGSQFVVRIDEFTSKGKKGHSVGDFGLAVWGVDNPEVASVPKNLEAIRLWKEARGITTGNGQSNGKSNGHSNGHASANGNGHGNGHAGAAKQAATADDI